MADEVAAFPQASEQPTVLRDLTCPWCTRSGQRAHIRAGGTTTATTCLKCGGFFKVGMVLKIEKLVVKE